jgi:cyclic pyranopterin phosphate synthase
MFSPPLRALPRLSRRTCGRFLGHLVPGSAQHPPHPQVVDISHKSSTAREATAEAHLVVASGDSASWWPADPAEEATLTTTATVAGIAAAKQTPTLIPMCHAVALSSCRVTVARPSQRPGGSAWVVGVQATARTLSRTGVEMEALVAASVCALTLYDMLKGKVPQSAMRVEQVRVLSKVGGKSDIAQGS